MISPVVPALTGNGLSMRSGLFLQALARIAEVDLLVVPVFGPARGLQNCKSWASRRCTRMQVLDRRPPDTYFELVSRLIDPEERLEAFEKYGKPSIAAWLSTETI